MSYPIEEIFRRARLGSASLLDGIALGADADPMKSFLDDILLLPPLFTPQRLEKGIELLREPLYVDVGTEVEVGGFKLRMPITCAPPGGRIADLSGPRIAEVCAEMGIAYSLGENIAPVRGYDVRLTDQPSFKERALSYLENLRGEYGGLIIQQGVKDEDLKLWERIYSDPDFDPYIERGLIAFEIKAEQIYLGDAKDEFMDDPGSALGGRYPASRTFTEEILAGQIRLLRNNFPRVRLFLRTGPYRDLDRVIEIASREGVDAITLDGEGAWISSLAGARVPALVCLSSISRARERGIETSMMISGMLYDGPSVLKSIALGADAVSLGEPVIYACLGGSKLSGLVKKLLGRNSRGLESLLGVAIKECRRGLMNYLKSIEVEMKVLASALGKYHVNRICKEDVCSLSRELADLFRIKYIYAPGGFPENWEIIQRYLEGLEHSPHADLMHR
ncbi:alpha-hydroxy-acid oxidizing protein [Candidatus Korarchaeum cryptofilum]|uniref:Ferredoxin-dependent glutamate synthase n=1 Tax=Korarchaeum cryptofilum (strain OPF8) TaxID=374847 RepID=B1L396_KORCO|nr:alpha-hydroxy-acid oxidizing protein [Candidatus Korarchaeum cryptofilum]ACB06925.1 ferredoxin-dependent glutamate synthase [Candidatus Korarchaeum cryptofilum OPF8]